MNSHALAVLEFARAVEVVARNATSVAGAARVRALVPQTDRAALEREQARVTAVRALRSSDGGWGPEPIPELGHTLAKLGVDAASWTPGEAHAAGALLSSAARMRATLRDSRRPVAAVAVLYELVEAIAIFPAVEQAIVRAIGDDGTVRDDASPSLRRLRRELRESEHELVRTLERVMARLDDRQRVADASVTVRNGRYVIPVRREAGGALGGIVHDTSASGATLFVEPPAAIEAANRIRELEIDNQREVDRILRELTEAARPFAAELATTHDALAEFDSLNARAAFAEAFECSAVDFGGDVWTVRSGRHPLLLAQGLPVVPFDLSMSREQRTLLVSGPNTGGKTVLLKALGLFQAMAQSGVPVPVAAGSVLPMVDDIFADVGDEQSIEASLSTFSAHLKNLREILFAATDQSLVLIDELGSGTDPAEGAALGAAILEELTQRGARTVATTHLGALKDLPVTVPGVQNASLQFDEARLAPTYRLLQGIPGRSYGLSIARRLELPNALLERAVARVPEQERAVSALLAELEQRERELSAREAASRADEAATHDHGRRIADREHAVRERERTAERMARTDARRYLLDARSELETAIAAVRGASAADRGAAERTARQTLERHADAHADALASLAALAALDADDSPPDATAPAAAAFAVGDVVDVDALGGKSGRLVELRGADAVVAVGAVKLSVPLGALRRSARVGVAEAPVASYGDLPEFHAKVEVDLRGVRVAALDELLMSSIDSAVRADLKSLRIIHGKGTGALRERVAEMLSKDVRVRAFRLGAWNEGGAGVTVAEFA